MKQYDPISRWWFEQITIAFLIAAAVACVLPAHAASVATDSGDMLTPQEWSAACLHAHGLVACSGETCRCLIDDDPNPIVGQPAPRVQLVVRFVSIGIDIPTDPPGGTVPRKKHADCAKRGINHMHLNW